MFHLFKVCSMVGCIKTQVLHFLVLPYFPSDFPQTHGTIVITGDHISALSFLSFNIPTTAWIRVTKLTRQKLCFRKCKLNTVFQIPPCPGHTTGKISRTTLAKVEILTTALPFFCEMDKYFSGTVQKNLFSDCLLTAFFHQCRKLSTW